MVDVFEKGGRRPVGSNLLVAQGRPIIAPRPSAVCPFRSLRPPAPRPPRPASYPTPPHLRPDHSPNQKPGGSSAPPPRQSLFSRFFLMGFICAFLSVPRLRRSPPFKQPGQRRVVGFRPGTRGTRQASFGLRGSKWVAPMTAQAAGGGASWNQPSPRSRPPRGGGGGPGQRASAGSRHQARCSFVSHRARIDKTCSPSRAPEGNLPTHHAVSGSIITQILLEIAVFPVGFRRKKAAPCRQSRGRRGVARGAGGRARRCRRGWVVWWTLLECAKGAGFSRTKVM